MTTERRIWGSEGNWSPAFRRALSLSGGESSETEDLGAGETQ